MSRINFERYCASRDIVAFCTAKHEATLVLPTIPQFTDLLKSRIPPHRSLFYDLGPGNQEDEIWYYSRYYGLSNLADFEDTTMMEKAYKAGMLSEYWNRMGAAYAYASTGPVYVLLPGDPTPDTSWYKGTIWDTQWSILNQNVAVTHIYRINTSILPTHGVDIMLPRPGLPPRHLE